MNIVNFDELKKELKIAKENEKMLENNQSEIDKLENTILHQLENTIRMDACSGFKFAKMLQETRIKRRTIKYQLAEQHCIVNKLEPFIKSMEGLHKGLDKSTEGGKRKYTKDFDTIQNTLSKITTL